MNSDNTDVTDVRVHRPLARFSLFPIPACWALAVPVPVTPFAAWIQMWGIVLALFIAAKMFTLARLPSLSPRLIKSRLFAYVLLWPGMDPHAFFADAVVPAPPLREWLMAGAKTLGGAVLLWAGVRLVPQAHPLFMAWVGMVGMVFFVHFGAFHLLSLFWRSRGIDARRIMRFPARATSLSEFWGRRWNAPFRDLMDAAFFRPLARRYGLILATAGVFLFSGVLHELVISWPARGGYGLPTAYFTLQAAGLLAERSRYGKALKLGSGFVGWCFVLLVAGVPSICLFHSKFIDAVILPMFHAIHAI
jgi:hypothetical protein